MQEKYAPNAVGPTAILIIICNSFHCSTPLHCSVVCFCNQMLRNCYE